MNRRRFLFYCGLTAWLCFVAPSLIHAADYNKVKVLLIGVDGISLNLLDPFMKRGLIPNLESVVKQGTMGTLKSFWPLRTMQVWTSMVTGKLPGQHGIWDHVTDSFFNPPEFRTKRRKIYTPEDRRSKALWNILSENGLKPQVVGWPTTWSAEMITGGVIVAPKVLYGDDRSVTIKGSFWRQAEGMVQPEKLLPKVKKWIIEPHQISKDDLSFLADVPAEGDPLYELPKIKQYVYTLRWSLARARSVEAITVGLARETRPEVVLAYFQCTDSLLHRFWIFQKPEAEIRARLEQFGISTNHIAQLKRHFGRVVENCYRDVDRRIGRILEAIRGEHTMVLVVSDHGFGDGPKKHPFSAEPYGGIHLTKGVVLAAGPQISSGVSLQKASVLDITPTILYALDLPVAKDMLGVVIKGLFKPSVLEHKPVRSIPSYEKKPQTEVPYPEGYPRKPDSFIW